MLQRAETSLGSDREARLIALALRQQGQITSAQLRHLGFSEADIRRRCQRRMLLRIHRGVYSVGRPASTPLERAAAAVLACGPGALLAHRSGLGLWGFEDRWAEPLHVVVAGDRRRPGIVIHKARGLTRADVRTHMGIRVTSVARALLDCAPDLSRRRLTRIAADARRQGTLGPNQLADVVERFPYHPGRAALLPLVSVSGPPARSGFEDCFPDFCARSGLPQPLMNMRICGYEVDAFFALEGVIVELDGWAFHNDHQAFEDDRLRDVDTLVAGLVTVRLTWERYTQQPDAEARRLHTILAARRDRTDRR